MDHVYTSWAIGDKKMSLDVVSRLLSDVEIRWNSFRAPFLASGRLAGWSLAEFEGELLLWGWRVLHNRASVDKTHLDKRLPLQVFGGVLGIYHIALLYVNPTRTRIPSRCPIHM
jgi:hypothetical protein